MMLLDFVSSGCYNKCCLDILLYYKILEDIIHYGLKDSRAISHTKEHYLRFKKSIVCIEDYLLLITRLNSDIIKFLADI